jgi:flagellar protein FlgJ
MAIESVNPSFFADPTALSGLRKDAAAQSPEALRETARQFESLFTTMMLKSMRSATEGDPLFGSDQQQFYQDMFDQQLAVQLSEGRGLGLADLMVRQLMQGGASSAVDTSLEPKSGLGLPLPQAGDSKSLPWPPRSEAEFIEAVRPAATAAARELGVDPDTVIAHAALETGWGKSVPTDANGQPSFNLFGIKATERWKGASTEARTHEFEAGRMQQVDASFRAYASPDESIRDYVQLLKSNPRYAAALDTGSDTAAFARGLKQGGYATDPDYVTKLTSVAARLKAQADRPITHTSAI